VKTYTETHEWIDEQGHVGISHAAQAELGEIVYVELPQIGQQLAEGEEAAVLESTKAACDTYSPVAGVVIAVNERLKDDPGLINRSPEQEGFLFQIKPK